MHELINSNFPWMIYNSILAVIPVILGWLFFSLRKTKLKSIIFIAWLAFIPNTIYLFTDVIHLIRDIRYVNFPSAIIILLQYFALFLAGFITYILSLYPIEKSFSKKYKKGKRNITMEIIIIINFLIGIGIVLGRVYRVNSWDIILQTENVIYALIHTVTTPQMIILAILFGLFANFLYFLFKKQTVKYILKKI